MVLLLFVVAVVLHVQESVSQAASTVLAVAVQLEQILLLVQSTVVCMIVTIAVNTYKCLELVHLNT